MIQQHIRSNDVCFPGEYVTEGRDFGSSAKVCVLLCWGWGFMMQLLMFTHMGLDEADYGILEWDFHVWSTLCGGGLRAH